MEALTAVVDTSILIAFYNKEDDLHGRARELLASAERMEFGRLLLPEHVFDEAVTFVLSRKGKQASVQLGEWLLNSSFELVFADERSFARAWNLFQKSGDLSFTDCFIASLAQEQNAAVLSFDSGFKRIARLKVIS